MLIGVFRHVPPQQGRCRSDACGAAIEWVRTLKGAALPLDVPVVPVNLSEHSDGREITWVDSTRSHWATCPDSSAFHRAFKGQGSLL